MNWTQGQPARVNQSPFLEPDEIRGQHTQSNSGANARTTEFPVERSAQPAASFSEQGLAVFIETFKSTVGTVLDNAMPGIVEQAVSKKMDELFNQIRHDLEVRFVSEVQTKMKSFFPKHLPTSAISECDIVVHPNATDESSENNVDVIVNGLKGIGRPVSTSELPSLIPAFHWDSNPSQTMTKVLAAAPGRVKRVGKGFYAYCAE